MSRLIKSTSVNIQSPRVIENRPGSPSPESSFAASAVDQSKLGDTVDDRDVGQVREQADDILRETEQMVKDLLETARQESEKIVKSANEEARRIVAEGQEKLKQLEEDACQKAWQAGYQEGAKAAEDEYDGRLQEAVALVEKARQEREKIVAGSEDEIVQLAMAVARKIIGQELTSSPEVIIDIVKRAIQKASDREELTVRVNPENLDSTINAKDEITQSAKGVRKMRILADPAIAPGGCVVESSNGTVDARVERQLNEIEQALMEVGPNA